MIFKDKKIIALVLVFIVLLGMYLIIVKNRDSKEKEQNIIDEKNFTVTAFVEDSLTAFSYMYKETGMDLHFVKQDKNWVCTDYPDYPINQFKVHDLLEKVIEITAERYLEPDAYDRSDPAYGLNDPQAIVTFTDAEKSVELKIGAMTGVWYYCVSSESDNLFAINNDLILAVDATILDLVNYTKIPGLRTNGINLVRMEYNGSEYVYTPNNATVTTTNDDGTEKEEQVVVWTCQKDGVLVDNDTDHISSGIEQLCNVEQTRCIAYQCPVEELEEHGLNDPYIVFNIDYVDNNSENQSFVLRIGLLNDVGTHRYLQVDDNPEITMCSEVFDKHILPDLLYNAGEVVDTQETDTVDTPLSEFDG